MLLSSDFEIHGYKSAYNYYWFGKCCIPSPSTAPSSVRYLLRYDRCAGDVVAVVVSERLLVMMMGVLLVVVGDVVVVPGRRLLM